MNNFEDSKVIEQFQNYQIQQSLLNKKIKIVSSQFSNFTQILKKKKHQISTKEIKKIIFCRHKSKQQLEVLNLIYLNQQFAQILLNYLLQFHNFEQFQNKYFDGLTKTEIYQIIQNLKLEIFSKNQMIYKKNDVSNDKCFIILKGDISKLSYQNSQNNSAITQQLNKGDCFGEEIFSNSSKLREDTLITNTNVQLLVFLFEDYLFVKHYEKYEYLQKKLEIIKSIPEIERFKGDLRQLMNEFEETRFIKDDIIVNLDEKGELIYLVFLGKCQLEVLVDLEKSAKNQNVQEFIVKVCELGSKEIFGEEILVNSTQTYQYIVKCSTVQTIVLTITQALFESKFPMIIKEAIHNNFLIKQNQRTQFIQACKEKYSFQTEQKVLFCEESDLSIPKKSTKLQTLFNRFEEIHNLKLSQPETKTQKMPLKLYENDNETEEYFSRFTYENKTNKTFSPSPIKKQQQVKIVTQINKRYNLEKPKTANDQIFRQSNKILLTQTALDKIQNKSKAEEICRAMTTQPKQKRFTNCFEYLNNKFLQEKIDECMLQKKKQQSVNITDQKSLSELKFNFGNTMDFPIERLIAANLIKNGVIQQSSKKKDFLAERNNSEKNQKISRSLMHRIKSAQMTSSQFNTPSPVKKQPQQIDYNLTMTEKFIKTQRSKSANLPFQITSTSRYNNQLKTNNFFRKFVLYRHKNMKTKTENYEESQEQFYQIGSQQKSESQRKFQQKSESCPKLFKQKKPTTQNL